MGLVTSKSSAFAKCYHEIVILFLRDLCLDILEEIARPVEQIDNRSWRAISDCSRQTVVQHPTELLGGHLVSTQTGNSSVGDDSCDQHTTTNY